MQISACPACIAAPSAERLAAGASQARDARIMLSLPTAHCATCIVDVERELARHPQVRSARVNLTLKRVSVEAEPGVEAADLVARLGRIGYEAHELDPDVLSATQADKRGRDILMRIGVSGFAMMNIMLLSVAVVVGRRGRDARSVPLDFGGHRAAHRGFCGPAVLCLGLGQPEGRAAGHGCADLAGDHPGLVDLGL